MTDSLALEPIEAMDSALAGHPCDLLRSDGSVTQLNVQQWTGAPDASDRFLFLDRCTGPTLDVGCGAGRLAAALTARGIEALGIDISTEAVRLARERGAVAVRNDIFTDVPHPGPWQYALLADTNIGIGGDPERLLRRVRQLLHPDGTILVEVEGTGTGVVREQVRLRVRGRVSEFFNWSRVGAGAIGDVAAAAGLHRCEVHQMNGRYVAALQHKERA